MNERIKELVKQAGGHFSTHILTSYPAQRRESIELWDNNIEKFAELLLKECIRVPYDMWDKAELNADIAVKIEHRIKEHFGVEE